MSGVIAQATPSSDEEYHSPAEREDTWAHSKDIGFGGFGVVKLFVNQVIGMSRVGAVFLVIGVETGHVGVL